MMGENRLAAGAGALLADNRNIMTACRRGPAIFRDEAGFGKLGRLERLMIRERRFRSKACGAYGAFTVTRDITRYTSAKIFSKVGKRTDLFARFSVAEGERDIRGFALKFRAEEGNWDLMVNGARVLFQRETLKFPDLKLATKREPRAGPGGGGMPYSFRHMHGFCNHVFSFINAKNKRYWAKFSLATRQGVKNISEPDIVKDNNGARRDLYESIERLDFPRWTLFMQVIPEKAAAAMSRNPFNLAKAWFHKAHPLMEVGVIELNRNPKGYFSEVERVEFNPGNVVPGISLYAEKPFQVCLFP